MSEEAEWRSDAIALTLLLSLVVLLFADVLFFGSRLFLRDLTRYYFPTKHILREMFLHGEFLLWNPLYGAGQPMAANPEYGVFYPLHLLLLLPNYAWAFQFLIVLHVAIGAAGMFLYLRSADMGRVASVFGAITFAFGGLTLSLLNLLPYLFILAWFPYAFLFARRLFIRPNIRDFCFAALFLTLQLFTAEPTTLLQVWAVITLDGISRGVTDANRRAALRRNVGIVLLLGIVVAVAGAVQLGPAFDLAKDSVRARGFDYALVTAWSMPVVRPLEVVFPFLLGHPYSEGAAQYWGASLIAPKQVPFLFSIYLGLMAGALSIAGLLARVRGGKLTVAICGIAYLFAIGGHTPLFRFLYSMRIASGIRYPEKFAIMGLLILTIFSARVLDEYLRGNERVRRQLLLVSIGLASVAGAAVLFSFAFGSTYEAMFSRMFGLTASPQSEAMIALSRTDWLVVLLKAVVLLILVRAGNRGTSARQWSIVAIAFVIVDLASVGRSIAPRMPREFFDPSPMVASLKSDVAGGRLFPESDWFGYYGFSRSAKLYESTGAGTYWSMRNGVAPQVPATYGIPMVLERDYDKTALLPTVELTDAMWRIYDTTRGTRRSLLMAMSNATVRTQYRDFYTEVQRIGGRPELVEPLATIQEESNPRYYFADHVERIRSVDDFVKQVSGSEWSRRTVFADVQPFAPSPGAVRVVKEEISSVVLDTAAPGQGFLVIVNTAHRYWRATVDGRPAPIVPSNVGYQGLILPPGQHRIVMRYSNPVLKVCSFFTLVAIVGLIAAPLAVRRKQSGRIVAS